MDWILAHRTQIGAVVAAIGGALKTIPDIPAWVSEIVISVGTFLLGAGAVKSDSFYKAK